MRFSTIFAATAIAGCATAADIKVAVGTKDGKLVYKPNSINATEGDTVIFSFWPKAHSVVQSSFAKPCEPLANGFWSGFVNTTDTEKVADTTFHYTVKNASAPIWFYCSQGMHCQSGMVGVINEKPASGNTLEKFTTSAKAAAMNMSPQIAAPLGGELTNSTGTTTPTASSSMPSSTSGSGNASSPAGTGAASSLEVNGLAISGVMGMFAYLMM